MNMNVGFIFWVVIFGKAAIAFADDGDCTGETEYCGDVGESVIETILLFPLSFTSNANQRNPLQDLDQIDSSGDTEKDSESVEEIMSAASSDPVQKKYSTFTDWVNEYIFNRYMLELMHNREWVVEYTWSLGTTVWNSAIRMKDNLVQVPEPLVQFKNCICGVATGQFGASITKNIIKILTYVGARTSDAVDFVKRNVEWPKTITDFLCYMAAILLGISMIPMLRAKDNSQLNETRQKENRITRPSKKDLEAHIEVANQVATSDYINLLSREQSPIQERPVEELDSGIKRLIRGLSKFKHKSNSDTTGHYLMCEYFDQMACNCGGAKVVQVQYDSSAADKVIEANEDCSKFFLCQSEEETPTANPDQLFTDWKQQNRLKELLNDYVNNVEAGIGDSTHIGRSSEKIATVEVYDNGTVKAELDLSVSTDIGEPCFNSSFKEESVYIITDAMETGNIGDGPDTHSPTIVTKRSPTKKMGLSFNDDTFSILNESFEENSENVEENDSLLDASCLNKSMSYTNSDGIFEFAVIYMVQFVYKWAKRFLRQRKTLKSSPLKESPRKRNIRSSHGMRLAVTENSRVDTVACDISKNATESSVDPNSVKDQTESKWAKYQTESDWVKDQTEPDWVKDQTESNLDKEQTEPDWVEDQTEPDWVKDQTESNLDKDQTEPDWVKDQTESDWVKDQTEPNWVKDQTESNWDKDQTEPDWVKEQTESDWVKNQTVSNWVKDQPESSYHDPLSDAVHNETNLLMQNDAILSAMTDFFGNISQTTNESLPFIYDNTDSRQIVFYHDSTDDSPDSQIPVSDAHIPEDHPIQFSDYTDNAHSNTHDDESYHPEEFKPE